MTKTHTPHKGFSLIEMLIVLALSSIVMAAFYRTVISQQSVYTVEDQIIEMQQNGRIAIDQMAREIRMAGYGGDMLNVFGSVNSFTGIVTAVNGAETDSVTIIRADEVAILTQDAAAGANQLQLSESSMFDTNKKKYLCLNGQNNYLVQNVSGSSVTLTNPLQEDHLANEPVHLVKAVTFRISAGTTDLVKDENTGNGGQILAENIEGLQLAYRLSDGSLVDSPASPSDIRLITIELTARTAMADPKHSGDGYRRQTINSMVELRNMGL